VQVAYERDALDRLAAPLPERCPLGDDGSECRVGVRGHRARKTGPRIALTIARCHRHGISFTVYPPAYVPYGRVAVTPVDLEGRRIEAEPGAPVAVAGTSWEAVADAAAGRRWPEAGGVVGSRRTQGRRLALSAWLFGVLSDARLRERVSPIVRMPALALHDAARSYPELTRWRARAKLVLHLLRRCLTGGPPDVLLAAGYVTGLWGRPSRWDPGGKRLRSLV
jgi:hypothetical protein